MALRVVRNLNGGAPEDYIMERRAKYLWLKICYCRSLPGFVADAQSTCLQMLTTVVVPFKAKRNGGRKIHLHRFFQPMKNCVLCGYSKLSDQV